MAKHIHIHIGSARTRDTDWQESKHKRDGSGRFSTTGAHGGNADHHDKQSAHHAAEAQKAEGAKRDEHHNASERHRYAAAKLKRAESEHALGNKASAQALLADAESHSDRASMHAAQAKLSPRQAALRESGSPRYAGRTNPPAPNKQAHVDAAQTARAQAKRAASPEEAAALIKVAEGHEAQAAGDPRAADATKAAHVEHGKAERAEQNKPLSRKNLVQHTKAGGDFPEVMFARPVAGKEYRGVKYAERGDIHKISRSFAEHHVAKGVLEPVPAKELNETPGLEYDGPGVQEAVERKWKADLNAQGKRIAITSNKGVPAQKIKKAGTSLSSAESAMTARKGGPLKAGERITVKPEHQEPGEADIEYTVKHAEDKGAVYATATKNGKTIPGEHLLRSDWIERAGK